MYRESFASFTSFLAQYMPGCSPVPYKPPAVAAWIAHLHRLGTAPSTVARHLAGLNFIGQALGYPSARSFLTDHVLLGLQKVSPRTDDRRPITLSLLRDLVESAQTHSLLNPYWQVLLPAAFTLAFFGFLRISELTGAHALSLDQVCITPTGSVLLSFRRFKHHSVGGTVNVEVPGRPMDPQLCPVHHLGKYLVHRGGSPGQLFLDDLANPMSSRQFSSLLNLVLDRTSGKSTRITPHSFRIGGTTHAAAMGLSPLQIRERGRWNSDAYLRYIRPSAALT